MKKYNYYYFEAPITRKTFESNVPENWENDINEYGDFSWGGYKALEKC